MRRVLAGLAAAVVLAGAAPAAAAPGPPEHPEYWFDNWDVPSVWAGGARGQGITIAEIDTGVNGSLPELAANVLPGKDFGSLGGDGRTDRSVDDLGFGHGTAMASIMVAHPGFADVTGLAPDAKLLPLAIPLGGTSEVGDGDHLAEAIRWAADHGADVISMSLGGSRRAATNVQACPADEQDAIYHALAQGAILFAASGNEGVDPGGVQEPGVCIGVVSVGAVDSSGAVAEFSSRHRYLTMTAPGVDVASLGRYEESGFFGDGTSQATAIASAGAALIWSKFPSLSGREVVTRMLATLDNRRDTRDPAYGFGTLDVAAAVSETVPASAGNPIFDVAGAYVARDRATSSVRLPPQPPLDFSRPPGTFAIGSAPSRGRTLLWTGVALGGAGVLLLVALAFAAVRRRRHRAPQTEDQAAKLV